MTDLQQALARYEAAVRELELATAVLGNLARRRVAVSLDTLRQATPEFPLTTRADVRAIQRIVADDFGVPVPLLWLRRKPEPVNTARLFAMALCRELTDAVSQELALAFARNEHGTILSAVKSVAARCETERPARERYARLRVACTAALKEAA